MKHGVTFFLNGKGVEVQVAPGEVLVDTLRESLGLTGTKAACREGECGSCTVLLDGEAVNSCMVLSTHVQGRNVLTIEGVSPGEGKLHPLQASFVQAGAVQCGFCTPGMVLTGLSLLEKNPQPTRDEIRQAISGNLCRCTGYVKIVDAIEAASCRKTTKKGANNDE